MTLMQNDRLGFIRVLRALHLQEKHVPKDLFWLLRNVKLHEYTYQSVGNRISCRFKLWYYAHIGSFYFNITFCE